MVEFRIPRDELPYNPADSSSIVYYASLLQGKSLRETVDNETLEDWQTKKGNKGALGQAIEYTFFDYLPNSEQEPDFPDVGIELKTNPVKRVNVGTSRENVSAKERLVLTMIDYEKLAEEKDAAWEDTMLYRKLNKILLVSYLYEPDRDVLDYKIVHVGMIDIPENDMDQIRRDWKTIVGEVVDGKAHEISSGDTVYLEACTKGASSKTMRTQPFSDIPAKQRAFALKSGYMTAMYRAWLGDTSLKGIERAAGQEKMGVEDLVMQRFAPYVGMSASRIAEMLGVRAKAKSKSFYDAVTKRILGVGEDDEVAEFLKADVAVRSIRMEESGGIREHISFPAFQFSELMAEPSWEDSTLLSQLDKRWLFVIYQYSDGQYRLRGCMFWAMPADALEQARETWEKTRDVIAQGVRIEPVVSANGSTVMCADGAPRFKNNLPGSAFNGVVHVRPHASNRAYLLADGTRVGDIEKDGSMLPDGRAMTKQCFWLDKDYIRDQLHKHGF